MTTKQMTMRDALRLLPLRKSMKIYASACNIPMVPLQYDDWEFVWDKEHSGICRSRGGSKTRDFIYWVIFRVLRTSEKWAWLTAKSGQLTQAMIYLNNNPFYKGLKTINIGSSRKVFVELVTGDLILIGIISTSALGLRLDGIIIDEEEDMEFKQSTEVYPQMEGTMTVSSAGQMIHLGTLWINTRFNEHIDIYPSRVRPWDTLPWLVKAGKIAKIMKNKNIPEWEKDMLYRCIATSPSGKVFNNLIIGPFIDKDGIPLNIQANKHGLDPGGIDHVVGGYYVPRKQLYITDEYELDIEKYPESLQQFRGKSLECESGWYNDSDRYGAKSQIALHQCGAQLQQATNLWKGVQQKELRSIPIYIDPERTPKTLADLKSAVFGPDGIYLKNTTDHQCHWLDAVFHLAHENRGIWQQST